MSTRKEKPPRPPRREQLTAATIEAADREGQVQLKLGRIASQVGAFLAIAYLFAVYIQALFAETGTSPIAVLDVETVVAVAPLVISAFVGAYGLVIKYRFMPTERGAGHMIASFFGMAIPLAAILVVLLDAIAVFTLASPQTEWLHFLTTLGAGLTLIGLATSWSGRGVHKVASVTFSVVPPSMVCLIILFEASLSLSASAFILAFTTAAVLYPVAGMSLHLLATNTNVDQRLILKSAEHKLKAMDSELGERLRALAFREKAVAELETDVQQRERELRELEVTNEQQRYELEELQSRVGAQFTEFKELEQSVTKMRAEYDGKVQETTRKDRELREREAELAQAKKVMAAREGAVAEREQEEKRLAIELKAKERKIIDTENELKDYEARIRQENEVLDRKRSEVVRLEKDMELRESSLKMRIEQSEATLAGQEQTRLREIRDYEEKVRTKEREVGALEVEVRSQLADFQRREDKIAEEMAAVASDKKRIDERDAELTAKEKAISDEESKLTRLRLEADASASEAKRLQEQLNTRTTEIDATFRDSQVRAADLDSRLRAIADKERAMAVQEAKLSGIQETLQNEIKSLNALNTQTLKKERELERREEDIGVRELELRRRLEATEAARGSAGEMDKALIERERRLHEKEEEFKRRQYEKEKELDIREKAIRAREIGEQLEGEEVPEVAQVSVQPESDGDRVKTGTRRFDDLLMGGFALNTHVAFVGPPFAGKEVLIYKFIAEGLRAKVPAVIVTTTRPPLDVAKEMAPVLPSLLEYERLGMLHWVDASGDAKAGREGNVWRVNKGSDFDGIYDTVSKIDEEFGRQQTPYFRLAYLTLSGSVGLSNEENALGFFQKLVNRLRQTKAVGIYALEGGMHSDQFLQALEHLLDGAVKFKQEGTKRFLSVIGVGEVQTRNWVEYTATNREVNLRAFALERIR